MASLSQPVRSIVAGTRAAPSVPVVRPLRGAISVGGLAAIGAVFLAAPVVVLMLRAILGGSLLASLASKAVLEGLGLSLLASAASLVVAVALGLPLAFVLARRRFRGSSVIETIVDLPIVLPPAVAGLALLLLLGRRSVIGEALDVVGIRLPFSTAAVVIAQTFVAMPFFVRSARHGIEAVPRDLEDAARVDGASELGLFRLVTVPLAGSALAAGLVMTWARALGEFGATILFAGNVEGQTQTLPLVVYGELQGGDINLSITAATILAASAFGVLVAVRRFHGGRLTERPDCG